MFSAPFLEKGAAVAGFRAIARSGFLKPWGCFPWPCLPRRGGDGGDGGDGGGRVASEKGRRLCDSNWVSCFLVRIALSSSPS